MKLQEYLKCLFASASAFVGALILATNDGSGITQNEWLIAASSALGALAIVWAVPNASPPAPPD